MTLLDWSMILRTVPLIAFLLFIFLGIARSNGSPLLPSRNAEVVLPLLSHFSPKEGYGKITEILGKEDFDIGNAYRECFFRLKDSPIIEVKASLDGEKIYFIRHGNDLIYSAR